MRYISLFLIIAAFYPFAVPASAQSLKIMNPTPEKITVSPLYESDGPVSAVSKIKINPGIIIYCDSCNLNFACTVPEISIAPKIDPEMIIHPPSNAIAKSMIMKPSDNIDPGMIFPKDKIYKRMEGEPFFFKTSIQFRE